MNQMEVKPYRQECNYYLVILLTPSVCFCKVLYYPDLVEYSSIIDVVDEFTQRIKFD